MYVETYNKFKKMLFNQTEILVNNKNELKILCTNKNKTNVTKANS